MKADDLLDMIGNVEENSIAEAKAPLKARGSRWAVRAGIAACLCLIAVGAAQLFRGRAADTAVQPWSPSISAADYFRNSGKGVSSAESSSGSLVMPPYAFAVSLNSERSAMENAGVLPAMPEHTEQSFQAAYHGDGSLYKVTFLWMRRGTHGLDGYSDLKLTASPEELHEVSDEITVKLDPDGNPVSADVTVTERDGVLIYAAGSEAEAKSLAWQTAQGRYQITGSWNDSYQDMVTLLDWFWAHPLSLTRFGTPTDGTVVFSDRREQPEVFREQIPDFSALGYTAESERVTLKRSGEALVPVWFEGVYTRSGIRVRWTVSVGADADAWAICLGRPDEVSEASVREAVLQNQRLNLFFDLPCMVSLRMEAGTGAEAWEIVQMLQTRPAAD